MSGFVDTYVSGPVQADLEAFAGNFATFVPSQPGRAAVAAGTDANGNSTPAQDAVGDPTLFYTLIRATFPIAAIVAAPFAVVDASVGSQLVGVFEA